MKKISLIILLNLFLIGIVRAEDCNMDKVWDLLLYEEANELFINALQPCAEGPDADPFAQLLLGEEYLYEHTVDGYGYTDDHEDLAKAFNLFEKSALQGNELAQLNLGYMYEDGLHIKKDIIKARDYYHQSANQGNSDAQFKMGMFYGDPAFIDTFLGRLELDYEVSLIWFKKAAENEYSPDGTAAYNVHVQYFNGWGTAKNERESHNWLKLAASLGHELAISEWNELSGNCISMAKAKNLEKVMEDFINLTQNPVIESPDSDDTSFLETVSSECEFYKETF